MNPSCRLYVLSLSSQACTLGKSLIKDLPKARLFSTCKNLQDPQIIEISSVKSLMKKTFYEADIWVFICSIGICVRSIAPFLRNKKTDPPILHLSENGQYLQSIIGAHQHILQETLAELSQRVQARILPSTSSQEKHVWNLDTLAKTFGWKEKKTHPTPKLLSQFLEQKPTLLITEIKDPGVSYLEKTLPKFVDLRHSSLNLITSPYQLCLYVGYQRPKFDIPTWSFYPPCLVLGSGCTRDIPAPTFITELKKLIRQHGISWESLSMLGTLDAKSKEKAYLQICQEEGWELKGIPASTLSSYPVPNPSSRVLKKVNTPSVSEAAVAHLIQEHSWIIPKQKKKIKTQHFFTYAIGLLPQYKRQGYIVIIGAGVGEDMLSLRGKAWLDQAEAVLYAGSLIPESTLQHIPDQAEKLDSASLSLEEQQEKISQWYGEGKCIVRLHSGDPSIYGAIQEQIIFFERENMSYEIIPGISAFQMAAARLKSELTLPERSQTIVLSRGEGKTPMPKTEKLENIAALRATLCLFLSAPLAKKIQTQLLKHYPPDTPLAVLYKIGEPEEKVHRSRLQELAELIKKHKYRRTTLIIIGEAIGKRVPTRSRLYHPQHYHIHRKKKKNIEKNTA
ncbi:MAG: precorrin-4 C(11)-methyltransferase [Cytophagales bacterium]|nr:precorrin-4 C(11)-methyltransferase [Cytophagales bacterium]